jgi:DNA-binding transcriptional ArsR family regulator
MITQKSFKSSLEDRYFTIFGRNRGGKVRREIITSLLERPYNTYQLAKKLKKAYNTIRHHITILNGGEHKIVRKDPDIKYGALYFITSTFNKEIFDQVSEVLDQIILPKKK